MVLIFVIKFALGAQQFGETVVGSIGAVQCPTRATNEYPAVINFARISDRRARDAFRLGAGPQHKRLRWFVC